MELVGYGTKFNLSILGYEYPNAIELDDASWLEIEIDASDRTGKAWTAKDCCLRTCELVLLLNWFQRIKKQDYNSSNISFTENELSFSFKEGLYLAVILDFRFHPNGNNYNYDNDEEYAIEFKLDDKALDKIINSLIVHIQNYPVKK